MASRNNYIAVRRCGRHRMTDFHQKRRSEVAAEGWRPSLTAARRFRARPLTRDVGTHCVHLHCSAARAEKQTLLPVVAKTDSFVLSLLQNSLIAENFPRLC